MTHRTSPGEAALRTREPQSAEYPRNEERTADPDRGTDAERSRERAARERRLDRSPPMPADRHE